MVKRKHHDDADTTCNFPPNIHQDIDALPSKSHNNNNIVEQDLLEKTKFYNRLMLLLTKPSYTLLTGSKNLQHQNRITLRSLLIKLVRQHNWAEASGVLSTLLKATQRESSPLNNRIKYSIAMEVLGQMENDANTYSKIIKRLYNEIWEKKIHSFRDRPLKDGHVELELVLSCLAKNDLDSAIQTARRLLQQRELVDDPKLNLLMGLTYYEAWFSGLKMEMEKSNIDVDWTPLDSETKGNNSYLIEDLKANDDAASMYETQSNVHYQSETSVINDKRSRESFSHRLNEEHRDDKINLPAEHHQQFRSQGFYMNSVDTSGESDRSFQGQYYRHHGSHVSRFPGLQSLLPLRLPSLDFLSANRGLFCDQYKDALKYLGLALCAAPPVSEAALLPLIQLLLVDDQFDEALTVVEKSCNDLDSVLPLRIRARLWECFDANNHEKLSASFEDVLKKDPTCRRSLAKLMHLHIKGDYAPERLVEMIALHIEAAYADHNTWREFASCLLKLSHSEEDRMSTCVNGEQFENEQDTTSCRIPGMFLEGMSGKTWKMRCKWWLNRHFSKITLASDLKAGDLQLMTSKAACASHLYGTKLEYIVGVLKHAEEHDRVLSSFLQMHIQSSVGFFSNLIRN